MASGKPTPDAPGLHTTRQMLDDLDALMERMLALPINDAEEPLPPTLAALSAAMPPAPSLSAKLTLLQVPVGDPPLDEPHPGTNPSHLPTLNAIRSTPTEPAPVLPPLPPAPPVALQPLSDRVEPPATQANMDALLADVPESAAALRWFIVPLLWGNRTFDRGTTFLGETGAWLRSTTGRTAVGLTGLVMLAAAGLWLIRDWLGWAW